MIEIKHRDTGDVLRTVNAETLRGADLYWANLRGANLYNADLRGADLIGANLSWADLIGANLSGAYLSGAYLSGMDLYKADLTGADLCWANLYGADLSRANLSRANLSRADLSRANLNGATMGEDKLSCLMARATRSDGHEFFLFALQDGSTKIKAGCRWMTIEDYRAHVAKEYSDTDKARETLNILRFFEGA